MKVKVLPLVLVLGLGSTAGLRAQQAAAPFPSFEERALLRFSQLQKATNTAAKTTIQKQRLLFHARYLDQGLGLQLFDSLGFRYGAERGSNFDYEEMQFSNVTGMGPQVAVNGIDFDTSFSVRPNPSMYDTATKRHDAAGRLLEENANHYYRNFYSYNVLGQMSLMRYENYNQSSAQWGRADSTVFCYNAAGQLTVDTAFAWNSSTGSYYLVFKDDYSYTGGGKVAQLTHTYLGANSPIGSSRTSNTYNAAGLQVARLREYWTGGAFQPTLIDSFVRNAGGMILSHTIYRTGSSTWIEDYREIRHLNAAGLPDSIYYENNNLGLTAPEHSWSIIDYNSFGNPVKIHNYPISGPVQESEHRFYYETYEATGISGTRDIPVLTLYPNPSTGESLQLKAVRAGKATIRLYGAAGKLLLEMNAEAGAAGEVITIPVLGLMPGQYWLEWQDESGNRTTGTFLRQ